MSQRKFAISKVTTVDVLGDHGFRGVCPSEEAEQVTFFNKIRREYPETYGLIATHIKNEGKRTGAQHARDAANGMVTGACDIIVGSWYCELKRRDPTKCKTTSEQVAYCETINKLCGRAVYALGWEAAYNDFLSHFGL